MVKRTETLKKAIKRARAIPDSQRARDLVLLRFGAYMFLFALIITSSFIFISLLARFLL